MTHAEDAEQAAKAGKWEIATYHALREIGEQQKVANLIAFTSAEWRNGNESMITSRDTALRCRELAFEALGLA